MGNSQIGPATLAATVAAAALALWLLPGSVGWLSSIGGFTLLLIVLAYDEKGYRTIFQSLAFSAVFGLCLMLASSSVLQFLAGQTGAPTANAHVPGEWLALIWVGVTIIFWPIDRARMSSRVIPGAPQTPSAVPSYRSFIPEFPSSTAASPDLSAPAPRVQTAPEPPFTPAAPFQPSPMQTAPVEPPRTQPPPVLARPGKETMIYVNLIGEGLNVLRTVRAEHLGRDFYKIIETMPEGETWEYQPGQVVRCKKKNLSSGKGLVATEEAPRAQ